MNTHAAILKYAEEHPAASTAEIASAVGTSPAYVIAARSRARRPRFQLSKENAQWLTSQSSAEGVSIDEFVNACITDARLDHEEKRQ